MIVLKIALNVTPIHLLVPPDYSEDYRITDSVNNTTDNERA